MTSYSLILSAVALISLLVRVKLAYVSLLPKSYVVE